MFTTSAGSLDSRSYAFGSPSYSNICVVRYEYLAGKAASGVGFDSPSTRGVGAYELHQSLAAYRADDGRLASLTSSPC